MRVLLVEDDTMIGESIRKGLKHDGYSVDWVRDGQAAELAIDSEPYAIVLLDIGLPRKDGFSVLEGLRQRGNRVPVLILTARDGVADRVKGLDSGADDYLPKPFYLDELAARIRAVMRRKADRAAPLVKCGALVLDPAMHKVRLRGQEVPVSSREFALLQALLERPGAMLSRAQLEERLYGWGEEVASNSVEVHIHNLRRKLGEDRIKTVRGVGYSIAGEEDIGAPA
jgi:two-component system, OmpR family, response regulator